MACRIHESRSSTWTTTSICQPFDVIELDAHLGVSPRPASLDAVYRALKVRHQRDRVPRNEVPARLTTVATIGIPTAYRAADDGWTITIRMRGSRTIARPSPCRAATTATIQSTRRAGASSSAARACAAGGKTVVPASRTFTSRFLVCPSCWLDTRSQRRRSTVTPVPDELNSV